jgi:deazaflavin-dependent oxidoreductase (nitroreductase family)
MPIPRHVGRFNRRFLNPITRPVAGWAPGFAIVEHRGRVSGRIYRTPVNAFRIPHGVVIALTYGQGTDWAQNVLAVGGARIRRVGRSHPYANPRIVRGDQGMRIVPALVRPPLRLLGVHEFLILEEGA